MSKFFKGFGLGAGLVAAFGAGLIAVKKINESDKKINERIRVIFHNRKHEKPCEDHCDCCCENETCDDSCLEADSAEFVEPITEEVEEVAEITQEDYLESVIEERDRLRAELDEYKARKAKVNKNKRK